MHCRPCSTCPTSPTAAGMWQLATTPALPTASGATRRYGPFPRAAGGAATVICRYPCCMLLAAPSSWPKVGACTAVQHLPFQTGVTGVLGSTCVHCLPACPADAALVVGGQHYDGWLSRTMWMYNATEDSWARVGDAPVYSRRHVCGLQHGRLFMTLGRQGQGEWWCGAGWGCVLQQDRPTPQQGITTLHLVSLSAEHGLSYEPGPLSARQFWAALPRELLQQQGT